MKPEEVRESVNKIQSGEAEKEFQEAEAALGLEETPRPPKDLQHMKDSAIIAEIRRNMRDKMADSSEFILAQYDVMTRNLEEATHIIIKQSQEIQKLQKHINMLENFLKEKGIPLGAVIPTTVVAQPNRQTRRKIEKIQKEFQNKAKKEAQAKTVSK